MASSPEEAAQHHDSDVSLDEDDEELIGRVFYSGLDHDSDVELSDDEDVSDISDLDGIDDPELVARYRHLKQRKVDKDLSEEDRRRLMMAAFSEDQMDRFEAYRRMRVNKPGLKKVVTSALGHSVPQNISVVLAGLSKSLLAELITKAMEVQEKENKAKLILDIDAKKNTKKRALESLEQGQAVEVQPAKLFYEGDVQIPLKPEHIREAWRLFQLENSGAMKVPFSGQGDSDGKFFR